MKLWSDTSLCDNRRLIFRLLGIGSSAAMIFGILTTICASAHIPTRRPNGLAALIFIFSFLAFVTQVISVCAIVVPYMKDQAKSGNSSFDYKSLKSQDYKLFYGFYLSVTATAFYLITFVLEFFGCRNVYSFDLK
uniref:5-hydroxytryptamine receptor 1B n=1 Tax=Lygus hesperus TaxID=30085 RepID=A0A0A9YJ82_LYGHE